ncbi:MAG: glycosyltransferase [Flavobacteriales bacterium]
MNKSVCHITNLHSWNDTRIFYKECIALSEAGYDVSFVAPNAEEKTENGVKILSVSNPSQSRLKRATSVAFKVFRKGLETKAKVIHFHDPELIWVGILFRIFGRKVIFDVHENVLAQIEDKEWLRFRGVVKLMYGFSEHLAAKLFYIVIAENSYEEIFKGRTNKITKVLNFPDIEKLKGLKKKSGGKGILYVGVVTESRAIIEIFQALKILQDKNIDFIFHCVGGVWEPTQKLIDNSPIYQEVKDKVTFYGRLPIYEAYQLADKCAMGISILHPMPNYLRSYSTKIFEYMAIGLPFVVSDFELYSFVKEKELGLCIDPESPEQIAEAFETILEGKIDIEAMTARGKEVVEKEYSWNAQKKNLLELYSQIFSK